MGNLTKNAANQKINLSFKKEDFMGPDNAVAIFTILTNAIGQSYKRSMIEI